MEDFLKSLDFPLSPADFATEMTKIFEGGGHGDMEGQHYDADQLMVEQLKALGYGEGAEIFDKPYKWYA